MTDSSSIDFQRVCTTNQGIGVTTTILLRLFQPGLVATAASRIELEIVERKTLYVGRVGNTYTTKNSV